MLFYITSHVAYDVIDLLYATYGESLYNNYIEMLIIIVWVCRCKPYMFLFARF